jgi:DNA-binding NtrC family response regulator
MKYFTLIGNHDALDRNQDGFGAALTIFFAHKDEIDSVYIFSSPDKPHFPYHQMAEKTKLRMESEKIGVEVIIKALDIENPADFELVYKAMLDEILAVIDADSIAEDEKIINITSGTPTMSTCWVLMQKSGLIKNAKLIQSFEPKYQRKYGKPCQVVNLEIDDFPEINAPSKVKRELNRTKKELTILKDEKKVSQVDSAIPGFIGQSRSIRSIKEQVLMLINSETHVLILGEPGTGKEIVSRAIWKLYRKEVDKELSVFDCGQFEPNLIRSELFGHVSGAFTGANHDKTGIVERCHGKTLYLDEIGNLSIELQLTLMRFLQFGEWKKVGADRANKSKIHIIAATNKDINDSNVFAPDLRDRFDEIIHIPPLRERREDVISLTDHFLMKNGKNISLAKSVFEKLLQFPWPGNVRQLEKWVSRICRMYQDTHLEWNDISESLKPDSYGLGEDEITYPEFPIDYNDYTDKLRLRALEIADGNMSQTDRLLGLNEGTTKQWMYQRKRRGG